MIYKFRYPLLIAAAVFALYARPLLHGAPVLNILLHAGAAVAVFMLGRTLGFRSIVAAAMALVFALHPERIEAVLEPAGREYALCAILTLAAMVAVLYPWRKIRHFAGLVLAITLLQGAILYHRPDYFSLPLLIAAVLVIYHRRFDFPRVFLWCELPLIVLLIFFPYEQLQPWRTVLANYGIIFWQTLIPLTVPPGIMPFLLMLLVLAAFSVPLLPGRPAFLNYWLLPCLACFLVSPVLLNPAAAGPAYLVSIFIWLPLFALAQLYWRDKYRKPLLFGMVIYLLILAGVSVVQTDTRLRRRQVDAMDITQMRDMYPAMVRALQGQDLTRAAAIARHIRQYRVLSSFEDFLYHGIAEFILKNLDGAEELFQQALAIAPGNDIATAHLKKIRELKETGPAPSGSTTDN